MPSYCGITEFAAVAGKGQAAGFLVRRRTPPKSGCREKLLVAFCSCPSHLGMLYELIGVVCISYIVRRL